MSEVGKYEEQLDAVLCQFDSKWASGSTFFDTVKPTSALKSGRGVSSTVNFVPAGGRSQAVLGSDFVNVTPVEPEGSFAGKLGIGVAVAAVVAILAGVGFLSDRVVNSGPSYTVSSATAAGQVGEVFANSGVEVERVGVEEFYYDDSDVLAGVIVFDPSEGVEDVVVWEAVENLYSTANAYEGSAVLSLASGVWLEGAEVSFGDSAGSYNVTLPGDDGDVCIFVDSSKGLLSSLAPVDCESGLLTKGGFSTDFSYGVSEEGKVLYDTAFGPLG